MPIKNDNNQSRSRLISRILLYATGGLLLLNLLSPVLFGTGIQRVPYSLFIHQVDENAKVSDLEDLKNIYQRILERYFAA